MVKQTNKDIISKPRKKYDYTPNENILYDLIIIGGGVVGLSAAMYAGRLGLKTLVIGELSGGTITLTEVIENYPGFISITGSELARLIENHAKDYDIDLLNDLVKKVEINKEKQRGSFKVLTKNNVFSSKTILFATGTKVKKLGIPGEDKFSGKGISYCVLCDGPLFKNKIVGIVGGSDSAVKEAVLLTEYAKKVYIIYRGEKVHPEPPNQKRMEEKIKQGKIEIINNTNVIEIKGDKMVNKVIFDKPYKGKKEFELEGLFIYAGHIPLSDLAKSIKVKTNEKGEIVINKNSETNIPGVYAAGDVADSEWKQAITGVAEGIKAAYYAYEYINKI